MNYYDEIKKKIIDNEVYSTVKDYSKERYKVLTYFEIGKLLTKAGGKYGDNIINEYSKKLVVEVGKKYNRRTLFRMRQFYNVFNNEKVSPLATQLTWSHYTELLSLKDINEIIFYINISINQNLSKRELRTRIKNNEYERVPEKTKKKIKNQDPSSVVDFIKNPIIIKNGKNYDIISEKILQTIILEDIPFFLKELGNEFTFVENEYKIKIGDKYNYIDLLLYNIKYKCYVVVELKVTQLKKEHTGQIQIYMNYIDKNIKTNNENETIGIIICRKENKYVIEYCSDNRIITRKYELI